MKIYSVFYDDIKPLEKYGEAKTISSPTELESDGILLLHGGEDIATSIYNQRPGSYTVYNTLTKRDQTEIACVKRAVELGVPIFGICRGAQLLTALAGGTLVQHVSGHTRDHLVDTYDGQTFEVTSVHHQMCDPTGSNFELLAWSQKNLSNYYYREYDDNTKPMTCEPEIIYYPEMKALACQSHPEWMSPRSYLVIYLQEQIEKRWFK